MVDNELITKVRVRNVKSILSNVFTSSGGTITNGNGTTANGSAVDLGGNIIGNTALTFGGNYELKFGSLLNGDKIQLRLNKSSSTSNQATLELLGDSGYASGLSLSTSGSSNPSVYFFNITPSASLYFGYDGSGFLLGLGSDATGDQYHRNASGYLVRRGTVIASSTSSLTINSDTTYQYSLTALAAALSIEAPTGTPFNGQDLLIRILDNGTARALTWNSIFRVIGVTLPTTTVISKTMYIACIYNSTDTKWDVIGVREQE